MIEADRPSTGQGQARPALAAVGAKAPSVSRAPSPPVAPSAPRALATPAPALPVAVLAAAPRGTVETKTVREILPPWHVLQEKLQSRAVSVAAPRNEALNQDAQLALEAQEAAASNWAPPLVPRTSADYSLDAMSPPPSSGVRMSESGPAVGSSAGFPDSLLSFKVYTLAELERRSDAPISMRSSRLSFDQTSSRSSQHWQRAATALRAFATASLAWLKIKGDRPNVKVALRKPFDELGDELQVAVESIDWKKLGVTTGIVVGATLTLLFAVLTAAELTDDLKPGSAAHLASVEASGIPAKTALGARNVAPATNMAAMGVQPVEPAPVVIAPPAPATTTIGDIDTPDTVAAAPAKKPAKKAAAKAKPKLTLRAAPF